MILKILTLSALLVGFASAYSDNQLANKIKAERGFIDEDPCISSWALGRQFATNPRGCSWFFVCNENGTVSQSRCQNDLLFDVQEQNCNFRDRVSCDYDDRWRNLVCPPERGVNVIPHPYSCSEYTVCFDGVQNDRRCPLGEHFSYFDGKCVEPFLADCNQDYYLCQEARETGIPQFHANSRGCGSYYLCVGSVAVPLQCAPDQHFDPEFNWCDSREALNCTSVLPDDSPSIPDKVFTEDCQGVANGVFLPHPQACDFFFICVEDRSYLQVCGVGQHFDIFTGRCEIVDRASCILNQTTEGTEEPEVPEVPEIPEAADGIRNFLRNFVRLLD